MKKITKISIVALLCTVTATFVYAQVFYTSLRITVLDKIGNHQKGAVVTLFATEDDYNNGENAVAGPTKTNEKGVVLFKKLQTKVYYVQAEKGDFDNSDGGVKTKKLDKKKLNKINIIITDF